MREMVKREWHEIRTGKAEPIPSGAGVMIAVASAYPVVWVVIAGGALIGWW